MKRRIFNRICSSPTTVLFVLLIAIGFLFLIRGAYLRSASASSSSMVAIAAKVDLHVTARAAGRGNGRANFADGHAIPTTFFAPATLNGVLQEGVAQPRSVAAADFDSDGTTDLVIGYSTPGGGVVSFQRGYVGAYSPQNEQEFERMKHGEFPAPFMQAARALPFSEPADFMVAGDFNRDTRQDVVFASRGASVLEFLAGDGRGGFAPARQVNLPGLVTALAGGDINRQDGAPDIAVAIARDGGAELLTYDSPGDVFATNPAVTQLGQPATSLAIGSLDDDTMIDVAAATGFAVTIIHGGDETQGDAHTVERVNLASEARQVAIGEFIWDRAGKTELAFLAADGQVHLLSRGQLDRRQYGVNELIAKRREIYRNDHDGKDIPQKFIEHLTERYLELGYARSVSTPKSTETVASNNWREAETLKVGTDGESVSAGNGVQPLLLSTRLSGESANDLLVVDPGNNKLRVLFAEADRTPVTIDKGNSTAASSELAGPRSLGKVRVAPSAIDVESGPVAALSMKLNAGTRDGILVLNQNQLAATPIITPAAITVDADRLDDATGAAQNCTSAPNDCTLRGAVIKTNHSAGADQINLIAGTYVLTQGPGDDEVVVGVDETKGDLDQLGTDFGGFADNDLTFLGSPLVAGLPVSIVSVALVGGPYASPGPGLLAPTNFDRVLEVDGFFGDSALSTVVTNVRMQNGNAAGPNGATDGGGAIAFYGYDYQGGAPPVLHGTLTLNSSVIANNTAPGGGINGAGGQLGGGISVPGGGSLVINSSTISGNTVTRDAGNTTAIIGTGGGIAFNGHGDGQSHLTISTTAFTSNQISLPLTDTRGGGIYITGIPSGQTGVIQTNSTFTSNSSSQDAGAVFLAPNVGALTISNTTFTSNTARRHGGAVLSDSRDSTVIGTQTLTSDTFLSNVADSDNNNVGDGGAIFHDRGTLNINSSVIGQSGSANVAFQGAGLAHRFLGGAGATGNISDITINGNSITFNTANGNGGGIYHDSVGQQSAAGGHSILTIASGVTSISNNTAKGNGGGLALGDLVSAASSVSISTPTIANNTSNSDNSGGGDGGGLYVNSGLGTVTLNASTVDSNVSTSATGDGAKLAGGILTFTGTINFNGGDSLDISGGTFNSTAGIFNLSGDFTRASASTFNHGNGTFNFNGANNQNINGTATSDTFNTFIVNKSNTLATGGSIATITTGNLTMTAGTFTAPATLDINGNLLLTAGTLNAGANITAAGNWTNNGGTFTPGTGLVTFDGAAGQTIDGNQATQTFNNFAVNKSAGTLSTAGSTVSLVMNNLTMTLGTFTAPATLDINGNTLLTAGTLTAGANITAAGNWTNNGGTFTPGSGTVTFDGGTANTLGGSAATQTFNNFTLNKGGGSLTGSGSTTTLTLNGSMLLTAGTLAAGTITTINMPVGDWTNNGGTFSPGSSNVNFTNAGANQNINGTAASQNFFTITINKPARSLIVGGSTTALDLDGSLIMTAGSFASPATLNIGGSFTQATGFTFTPPPSITFDGTAAGNIDGTLATKTFNDVVIAKTNTLTGAAGTTAIDINGQLTLTSGTFAAGTATAITISGNWTNNGGTFTPGSGTVTFDGGAGQTIGGTTSTTFNNLTNADAGGISMTNDNSVNGVLALTSSDITVAATKTLTQPSTVASTGTFDVVGRVKRNTPSPLSSAVGYTFGNPNNIVTFTAAGTRPSDLTVDLAKSVPTGAIAYPNAVQRTYTITATGGSGFSATLRLHYLDSELNGNTEGAGLNLWQYNGVGWAPRVITGFDTTANWVEKSGVTSFSPWTMNSTNAPTASNGIVSGRIADAGGVGISGAVILLDGAQNRKTITDANGNYRFDNVETNGFYTVTPSRANYTFSPAQRSFSQLGNSTEAVFTASPTAITANPLDTAEYFVRQHYVDFLGREPDESGFNFWSDEVLNCGSDAACIERKRVNVSAAYFLSIEFQQTGGLVDGLYRVSYERAPLFGEFAPDSHIIANGVIVGKSGWDQQLETNKQAFIDAFVQRPGFVATYGSLSDQGYVDKLIANSGVTFTSNERNALVDGLGNHSLTRATVLRQIAEDQRFVAAKFNQAFVLMEYFGYLRRDPDADGYQFWLNKLNQFGGNFEQAEMVKAFISSTEYRERFPR